jgi:hypothetical protein
MDVLRVVHLIAFNCPEPGRHTRNVTIPMGRADADALVRRARALGVFAVALPAQWQAAGRP